MAKKPSKRRRRLGRLALLAVGLWLVGVAWTAATATLDIAGARLDARELRSTPLEELTDPAVGAKARATAARFDRAAERLAGPLLSPLRVIPVLGRQVRSATALTRASAEVAGIAADGLEGGRRLARSPRTTGAERLTMIKEAGALVARTQRRFEDLDLGPRTGLVQPLARRRDVLRDEVVAIRTGLVRAELGTTALARLLGGPRRYVVFAANNAEMRAGSGLFLSLGELTTGDGRFQLDHMRTVLDVPVPPGAVPPTGDLASRWGWLHPSEDWRNLMLSPRFDVAASLATRMWEAAGQQPAEGVLVLDPVALQSILAATGPVTVDGVEYGEDNVIHELLREQYLRMPSLEQRPERRERLGAIAAATIGAMDAGHWTPEKLAAGLTRAAQGRHLLMWSSRPDEWAGWQAVGAGGTLREDSLGVSIINRGGNKLDQFLEVRAELEVGEPRRGRRAGVVRIHVRNEAPPDDPAYIVGPHFGLPLQAGDYLGFVTVTLPGTARRSRLDGIEQLIVAGPDGPTRVIGAEVLLHRGEARTIVARFDLPANVTSVRVEPSGRVPAITWRAQGVRWLDTRPRTAHW